MFSSYLTFTHCCKSAFKFSSEVMSYFGSGHLKMEKWSKLLCCTNKLDSTESFLRKLSNSLYLELTCTYLFWVLQKLSHLMMPWWTMLSCSHWAYSALFSLDMNAVSCSFHWSVSSMMTFRSCESYRKTGTLLCVLLRHHWCSGTCWFFMLLYRNRRC